MPRSGRIVANPYFTNGKVRVGGNPGKKSKSDPPLRMAPALDSPGISPTKKSRSSRSGQMGLAILQGNDSSSSPKIVSGRSRALRYPRLAAPASKLILLLLKLDLREWDLDRRSQLVRPLRSDRAVKRDRSVQDRGMSSRHQRIEL